MLEGERAGTLSKKDEIYERLVERLVHARYAFGDAILVKEIAAETGASRQPIMTALERLAADGFVRIVPQVGCQVINPYREAIADFFRMFQRMEGLLAELAAERREERQLRDLVAAHRRTEALDLTQAGAGQGYVELNQEFHRLIHDMARSPMLRARQRSNFAMSDFFINHAAGFETFVPDAIEDHGAIIAAIRDKDAERARNLAEAHIAAVAAAVLAGLARPDEKGKAPAAEAA